MKQTQQKMSYVVQNVILGTITGAMVAYNLRIIFTRIGATDLIWIFFILLGPTLGYLSGKERQRLERLRNEKEHLEEDLTKIRSALSQTTKKYRLLVEYANDAIFLTTVGGRFVLYNEAMCLLSGYNKKELKNMNISQLQVDEEMTEKHRTAWLDNGIYRYEETWRNKNGDEVILDINARYIKLGVHQVILHVGRDVIRQSETNQENKVQDIRSFQESKLMEISHVQSILTRLTSAPLRQTTQLIQSLLQEYPQEEKRLSPVISDWKIAQKYMRWLSAKNARDLKVTPCRWDLNDILKQELFYMELLSGTKGFIKQTSFSSNNPLVFGFGRDFSLAFGTVLKAALESLSKSAGNKFSVSTRTMDDHNLVEIDIDGSVKFKETLCKITDPFFRDEDSKARGKTEIGFLACQRFFETLGSKMDVGQRGDESTIVRIRVPAIEEKGEVQSIRLVEGSKHSLII